MVGFKEVLYYPTQGIARGGNENEEKGGGNTSGSHSDTKMKEEEKTYQPDIFHLPYLFDISHRRSTSPHFPFFLHLPKSSFHPKFQTPPPVAIAVATNGLTKQPNPIQSMHDALPTMRKSVTNGSHKHIPL